MKSRYHVSDDEYYSLSNLRGFIRHIQGTTTLDCPVAIDLLGSTDLCERERRGRLKMYLFDRAYVGLNPHASYHDFVCGHEIKGGIW